MLLAVEIFLPFLTSYSHKCFSFLKNLWSTLQLFKNFETMVWIILTVSWPIYSSTAISVFRTASLLTVMDNFSAQPMLDDLFNSRPPVREARLKKHLMKWILFIKYKKNEPSYQMQYLYTSTRVGSNNHVRFSSPTNTWNKLPFTIANLVSRNGVNASKCVRSNWHWQRSIVSINLKEKESVNCLNQLAKEVVKHLGCSTLITTLWC